MGGFELLLAYNWIIKGWEDAVKVGPGLLGPLQHRKFLAALPKLQLAPMLSFACSCGGH